MKNHRAPQVKFWENEISIFTKLQKTICCEGRSPTNGRRFICFHHSKRPKPFLVKAMLSLPPLPKQTLVMDWRGGGAELYLHCNSRARRGIWQVHSRLMEETNWGGGGGAGEGGINSDQSRMYTGPLLDHLPSNSRFKSFNLGFCTKRQEDKT